MRKFMGQSFRMFCELILTNINKTIPFEYEAVSSEPTLIFYRISREGRSVCTLCFGEDIIYIPLNELCKIYKNKISKYLR